VWVCQMVHHHKYPTNSQTKTMLEIFPDTLATFCHYVCYYYLLVVFPNVSWSVVETLLAIWHLLTFPVKLG
jgi:hypothetical protein